MPIDSSNAEHYVWGDRCDGWYLLKNDALTVIQECMPPGTAEVRHYHKKSRQFFYVLSGSASLECGGREEMVNPRQGLEIPPGVPHQIRNKGNAALEFLVISQPPSHGDRFNVPED
jgi:mannose-6-phosphate isomerase-like protein (cupin superfamily)